MLAMDVIAMVMDIVIGLELLRHLIDVMAMVMDIG